MTTEKRLRRGEKRIPCLQGLTYAQQERLTILGEEVSKLNGVVMRSLRTGLDYVHPERAALRITNSAELEARIGRVLAMVNILCMRGDISDEMIDRAETKMMQEFPDGCIYQEDLEE